MTVGVVQKWEGTVLLAAGQNNVTVGVGLAGAPGVLNFNTSGAGNNAPTDDYVLGDIESDTTVRFKRKGTSQDITIQYEVLALSGDVSAQSGLTSNTGGSLNVTVSAVNSLATTLELFNGLIRSGSTVNTIASGYIQMLDTTTLQIVWGASGSNRETAWQLLDFSDPNDIDVQRGTQPFTSGQTSLNTTIAAVDTDIALHLVNGVANNQSPHYPRDHGYVGVVNSATQINHWRDRANYASTVGWLVAECKWLQALQTGSKSISAGLTGTIAITAVDNTKSLALAGSNIWSGFGGSSTTYSANDNVFYTQGRFNFDSDTQIGINRSKTNAQTWTWYALPFETEAPPAEVLTIADLDHGHLLDAVVLGRTLPLTVADLDHGHLLDALTLELIEIYLLTVADLDHGHLLDALTLIPTRALVTDDLDHGHLLDTADLEFTGYVLPEDLDHGHLLDGIVLSAQHTLVAGDLDHTHLLTDADLSFPPKDLLIAGMTHNGHILGDADLVQTLLMVIAGLDHGHDLESPTPTGSHNLSPDQLQHGHELENVTLSDLQPFGGYARRKLAGTGSGYAIYPADPANFRLDATKGALEIERWLPRVNDGLTHARYEVYRGSNLVATTTINQNIDCCGFEPLFFIDFPLAGDYQIRVYDDVQSSLGGGGSFVYKDAFQITIFEQPSLNIGDLTHDHQLFSAQVSQQSTFIQGILVHDHFIDAINLGRTQVAAVADLDHAHELDTIYWSLPAENLDHGHTIEGDLDLEFIRGIPPDDLLHGHTISESVVSAQQNLEINDLDHPHQLQQANIILGLGVDLQDLMHAHYLDETLLYAGNVLLINDLDHAHQLDDADLVQQLPLVVDDLDHGHEVDAVTLESLHVVDSQPLEHPHVVDSIVLTGFYDIESIFSMLHLHEVEHAALIFNEPQPPANRTYTVRAETRVYRVRAENRTYTVR